MINNLKQKKSYYSHS